MSDPDLPFDEVYAEPGARHIIAPIHPGTGLSWYGGKTQAEILAEYPAARRMRYEDWQTEVSAMQRTPVEWLPSSLAQYTEMLEVLPPAYWSRGAFLVGEPDDHDVLTGAPRFAAYRQIGDQYFRASRALTVRELRAILDA